MPLSLRPGMLADRYRPDSLIAVGGMGEVWRAVDLVLDRPVAVKVLRHEYAEHAETLDRFRAEARHAAGLSHPAIAQVYDFGEGQDGQPPFLVLELVDGQPLTSLLASGPLGLGRTLDVVAQVAAGLAVAHAAGVMHRDIKPGNLLVDARGGVKITDFGIAYAAGSTPLTRTGMVMGTPAYLAPERVGGAPAGPASDLYSLGMVAYHCLTGRLPFTGTALEIALAQRSQPLPPLPDSVPPQVAALVASLTAREPTMRPAGAAQVATTAAALCTELSGESASAVGPAVRAAGATSRYEPEHPAGAGAADDDAATRLLAALPAQPARSSSRGGHGSAHRSGRRAVVAVVAALVLAACLAGWVLASSASPGKPGQAASHPPSSQSAARTVLVRTSALVGQPVHAVERDLRRRGMIVTIRWVPARGHRPGTVVAVSPSGRLRPDTGVRLTAARRPPTRPHRGRNARKPDGHGHGRGHDHGHGHGDGQNGNAQARAG